MYPRRMIVGADGIERMNIITDLKIEGEDVYVSTEYLSTHNILNKNIKLLNLTTGSVDKEVDISIGLTYQSDRIYMSINTVGIYPYSKTLLIEDEEAYFKVLVDSITNKISESNSKFVKDYIKALEQEMLEHYVKNFDLMPILNRNLNIFSTVYEVGTTKELGNGSGLSISTYRAASFIKAKISINELAVKKELPTHVDVSIYMYGKKYNLFNVEKETETYKSKPMIGCVKFMNTNSMVKAIPNADSKDKERSFSNVKLIDLPSNITDVSIRADMLNDIDESILLEYHKAMKPNRLSQTIDVNRFLLGRREDICSINE